MNFKNLVLAIIFSAGFFFSCDSQMKNVSLQTTEDSLSYSIGLKVAENVAADFQKQGIDTIMNLDAVLAGMRHEFLDGDKKMTSKEAEKVMNEYFQALQVERKKERDKQAVENLKKGEEFLAENKKKENVQVMESGLQYIVMEEGTGPKPKADDIVKAHYHGMLMDGTVFDSSVERGQPFKTKVNGVIKGWQEALQNMKVGSKWKIFVPPHLAYGERGAGEVIGPNETLVFEMELLSIEEKPEQKK